MPDAAIRFDEALLLGRAHEQLWPQHNVYLVRSVSRPFLSVRCDECQWAFRIDALERHGV